MERRFKLSNGDEGTINIDEMIVDIKGEDWVEEYIADKILELEAKIKQPD